MSPHSKQKPLPCSNGVMGNDPKTFFIGHSLGLRPPPESGVTTKWGAERPKSLPLSRSEWGWLTSPTSCVAERQPRVLKITSTLPKDLGKEDNIKASLGRAPAATQCCAHREAPKMWGPSPALTGRDRAGLGGNRWPGSRKLPKELEPWGRSCSGPQQWQRQAERRCRKWREADKRGAATLNRKTTQGEVKGSHSAVSDSLQPRGLYSPRNSPGQNTGVGSLSLLQGIFPTQESNQGLLHCRQILYQLSYQGSPNKLRMSQVRLDTTYWVITLFPNVRLCLSQICNYMASPSMGFSRQEYYSGLPFSSPGDLPNPGIEPQSPTLRTDTLPSESLGKSQENKTETATDNKLRKGKRSPVSAVHLQYLRNLSRSSFLG